MILFSDQFYWTIVQGLYEPNKWKMDDNFKSERFFND